MSKKNNYYYKNKKNYYEKEKKNNEVKEKKVTYDSLMQANTVTTTVENDVYNKTTIIKYVAISAVLFAIIIGSLLLFRQV